MELLKEKNKYLLIEDNETAGYVEFEIKDDTLSVLHTFVNEKFRGKGIARSLLEEVRIYAETNNLRIYSVCSFAAKYFGR